MTLTAGTTLQSNKYVIQAVLNQSDFGITYQAKHAFLEQSIFLQTFNPVVQQRSDFTELRRQFLSGVRSLSQRSDVLRVLDCFEEQGLPYVVLQAMPNQSPPQLKDWLTLKLDPPVAPAQPREVASSAQSPAVPPSQSSASAMPSTPESSPLEPVISDAVQPVALEAEPAQSQPQESPVGPEAPQTAAVAVTSNSATAAATAPKTAVPPAADLAKAQQISLPQISIASTNGKNGRSPQIVPPRPQRRIPVALLMTALAGLGLGAGTGFALRYHPTHSTVTSSVPSLFGHKQAFPAEGDWPVTEIPNALSPEPKVAEPFYRTTPAPSYYTPDYKTSIPQPERASYPTNLPPAVEAEPSPETKPSPGALIPKRSDALPANSEPQGQPIDPPSIPPAAVNPSPNLPPLPAPVATPAPAPYPPAVDSAPPAHVPKALPTNQPPIVSQ
ncbi:MAG TPA: hypothetical protein V6C57_14785 [Coleofasciculaceae cyanobacterium]